MIFYESVIKSITKGVYSKVKSTTDRLNQMIIDVEKKANTVFATKREVENKIEEIKGVITNEKKSILETIGDKLLTVASADAVMSLAKGLNERLDNMYYALEVTKTQAVNQATENVQIATQQIQTVLGGVAEKIEENTSEILKNQQQTSELKTIVDGLVPQIIATLDTASLTSIIDSLVHVELQAIEERLRSEMGGGTTTETTTQQYTTPGVYINEQNAFPATVYPVNVSFPGSFPETLTGEAITRYSLVPKAVNGLALVDTLVNYDNISRPYINMSAMIETTGDIEIDMYVLDENGGVVHQYTAALIQGVNSSQSEYTGVLAPAAYIRVEPILDTNS